MNFNKAFAEAISKGAVKAVRKPMTTLRSDLAQLKREVADLKRLLKGLQRQPKSVAAPEIETETETVEKAAPKLRPTSATVLKLRQKLGITQAEFAKLAGVSALTISNWETAGGRIRMRGPTLQGFAKVKAMGKRDVKKALAAPVA